jgi:hypothetical protein
MIYYDSILYNENAFRINKNSYECSFKNMCMSLQVMGIFESKRTVIDKV